MNKSALRTAMFFAILAGLFILLDLAMDVLVGGGMAALAWSHVLFSVAVVIIVLIIITRVMETRRRAEVVLRQAHDELEERVQERTAELERMNNMLHTLLNTLPAGLIITDADGEVVLANSIARDILGETLGGILDGGNEEVQLHQMDGSRFPPGKDPLSRAIQYGETITGVEAQLLQEGENTAYLLLAASPVRDEYGQVRNAVEVVQDITELKRIEAKIAHLASFPQVNPNPILEIDSTGAIVFRNPEVARTLRRLGLEDDPHVFLPVDMAVILKELVNKKETLFQREVRIGNTIFGETVHLIPTFNVVRIYAFDINELKIAEKNLQQSLAEAQQRQAEVTALLAGSRAVLEQPEFEAAARSIFDACKALLGAAGGYVALVTEDNQQNLPVYLDPGGLTSLVDPELPMPIRGLREQVYRTGQATYENDFAQSEWVKLLPPGHIDLENVLFAPLTMSGIVIGLLGLANKPGGFNDNDARLASAFAELAAVALVNKRTLELLKNSEERHRSVVQSANDAIITVDLKGNIIFWNNAAEKIFGYPASEVTGLPVTRIMPRKTRQAHEEIFQHTLSLGNFPMVGKTVEGTLLRRDGSEFPTEISLTSWQTREGLFFTSTVRDITERKEAEEALRQMQVKLAVGIQERTALEERQRLARELHDSVSQALYGISLGANTALTLFETDQAKTLEAVKFVLSQAHAGLTEMRALIFELRPESLEMEGLATALAKQVSAFRERYGLEVEVSLCDEPDVPLATKEALYRVAQEALQNVAKHARASWLSVHLAQEPEGLILEVCDDGVGFDPKAAFPGHLGLQSMRERAMKVGGFLEINSAPKRGSQIRVHIPISSA